MGGGWWVVGVNGFYKVHCKSTHHHHPTFNPSYHQHSTFITQHPTPITQHPTPNIQPHTSSTPNIQHPTPIISHPINFI